MGVLGLTAKAVRAAKTTKQGCATVNALRLQSNNPENPEGTEGTAGTESGAETESTEETERDAAGH